MNISDSLIRDVVEEVVKRVEAATSGSASPSRPSAVGRHGQFERVDDAVAAADEAFDRLSRESVETRRRAIDIIRRISFDQCVELGTMEMEETKIGRLQHKIDKQRGVAVTAPGVEFLRSEVFSGDKGLTVIEHAPFGVIGAITPVTHSLPTITCNAINMIAGGNTVVVNPHPGGKRIAAEGVRRYNEAIHREIGIDNLICVLVEPTLETAGEVFEHPGIAMLSITGGPAVAKAALMAGKRATVAGPGNPPVVVDETADLDRAARCIIQGCAFDNNLLCIAEKQTFVVDAVFDKMLAAFARAGAVQLNSQEIERLTSQAIMPGKHHPVASKDFVGKDAAVLARAAGRDVPASCEMVFGVVEREDHPFVLAEQMMPFMPVVRARCIDEAIEMAVRSEHGFRHTAIIHSHDVTNMTKMGRAVDTTLFIKNGPSMAGLGNGGEGYPSYSIAGMTGEGVTTPLTFTRERRCTMVENLRILGR